MYILTILAPLFKITLFLLLTSNMKLCYLYYVQSQFTKTKFFLIIINSYLLMCYELEKETYLITKLFVLI